MRIATSSPEWFALYREFLDSPEWQKKRALILKRANGTCEGCLSAPASDVHHCVYPQKRSGKLTLADFANQVNYQLRALCRPCHKRETENRR